MYSSYIVKRTQIYLDEEQAARLARRAQARGSTSSRLIREAVEEYLTNSDDPLTELARQRRALEEAFGSVPRLPEGSAYVDQVRESDAERERELEERWRSS
jgi:predicted DNA-binding protein